MYDDVEDRVPLKTRSVQREDVKRTGEGVYSESELSNVAQQVEKLTAARRPPPNKNLNGEQILDIIRNKISAYSSKSSDQLRKLHMLFGGSINQEIPIDEFKNKWNVLA